MDNIFNTIVNKLPETPAAVKDKIAELDNASIANNDFNALIAKWQKSPNEEDTATILHKLQPTIKSAIHSYAPDSGTSLKIKAAGIAINALKSFDTKKGASPSTHVFNHLKRLNRIAGQRANIIHVPENKSNSKLLLNKTISEFIEDNDREPSTEELADITGFPIKKIDKLLNDNAVISESSTLSEDSRQSGFTSKQLTDDDYFEYVYASVGAIDKSIMEWSAGKHGKPQLANQDIAAKLKITPAAVSMRKQKIQQMLSDIRGAL